MNPIVRAIDVRKSFGEFQALKGITLDVAKGEVLCVIGPSGSGKSTFLRCINQLEAVSDGSLWVNGELLGFRQSGNKLHELSEKQIARQRLATGMVFQRFNLFPHMTVLENVIEGPVQVLKRLRGATWIIWAPRTTGSAISRRSSTTSLTTRRRTPTCITSSAGGSKRRIPLQRYRSR